MAKRMLVDATHPEETRVVVVNGTKLEEFDFETSTKKQLKGNIYLAKVIRIEPSLQAAFVEYGGNRHGFLAFSEIHPDYYQIPVADREAILRRTGTPRASGGREREARNVRAPAAVVTTGRGRASRPRRRASQRTDNVALSDADAIDAMVPPTRRRWTTSPWSPNWDHEAARRATTGRRRQRCDPSPTTHRARAIEPSRPIAATEDLRRTRDAQPERRFPRFRTGLAERSEDRAQLPPSPSRRGRRAGDSSGSEPEPARSYAAERQEWPATYAEDLTMQPTTPVGR